MIKDMINEALKEVISDTFEWCADHDSDGKGVSYIHGAYDMAALLIDKLEGHNSETTK